MAKTLWREHSFTILVGGEAGTTSVAMLTYDPVLSRVRIDVSVAATIDGGPAPATATMVVQRSTDLIGWTTVRGGSSLPVSADALPLNDNEFAPGVENQYRILVYDEGILLHTFLDAITVVIDEPWLKSVARPFLNRKIIGSTGSPVTRTARNGVFPIVGRSLPIAVTDVRGGRGFELVIQTHTEQERRDIDMLVASGDVVLLQVPADYPVPGGYYVIGDDSSDRQGMPWERRWWTLPLTEVAAPTAVIGSASITWRGIARMFGTWQELLDALATWRLVLEQIGQPEDVIVP